MRRAAALLREYDSNDDGRLTRDELVELVSRLIHSYMVLRPQHRNRGKWTKPKDDRVEPARTERLLARPFGLRRATATDCQDAMSMHLFAKVSGDRFLGLCFSWGSMFVQVVIGIISGFGPSFAGDNTAATTHAVVVAVAKLGWAAILAIFAPCACLLTNSVIATMFTVEGIAALLMVVGDEGSVETVCLLLLLTRARV